MAERPAEPQPHGQDNPTRDALARFAGCRAAAEERKAVVRHLLTGCLDCAAVLWPFWKTVEWLARRRATKPRTARRRQGGRARAARR